MFVDHGMGVMITFAALLVSVQPSVIRNDHSSIPFLEKTSDDNDNDFDRIAEILPHGSRAKNYNLMISRFAYFDGSFNYTSVLEDRHLKDEGLDNIEAYPHLQASPLTLPNAKEFSYIATESPSRLESEAKKKVKASLYWDMVWKTTRSRVILVNLIESAEHIPLDEGQEKTFPVPVSSCHVDKKCEHSAYTVTCIGVEDSLRDRQGIIQRELELKFGDHKRRAIYVGYERWEELSSAPVEDLQSILNVMTKARRNEPKAVSVINCKWGQGRTGTLTALDWLTRVVKEQPDWYTSSTSDSILGIVQDKFPQLQTSKKGVLESLIKPDPILGAILYMRQFRIDFVDDPEQIDTIRKYMVETREC